jgi:hypothetical protein
MGVIDQFVVYAEAADSMIGNYSYHEQANRSEAEGQTNFALQRKPGARFATRLQSAFRAEK